MKKIYLIRHGQTDYNNKGIVQGRGIDTSLNSLGEQQALAFYERYKHIPFDKIYTSSLRRTAETVRFFLEDGIPHEQLDGLDEISWGISEGLQYSEANNRRYYGIINEWKEGNLGIKIKDGESPLDVQARQEKAIQYILSNTNEKTILICMHGRAMRIMLSWMMKEPLEEMDSFAHDNTSLYLLRYDNEQFSIDIHNDTRHLTQLHQNGKT